MDLIGGMSLPTRERGLKLSFMLIRIYHLRVAPHAGAWIETSHVKPFKYFNYVAPHAGAWIETCISKMICIGL